MHAQYFSRTLMGAPEVKRDTQGKVNVLEASELMCSVL